MDFLRNTLQQLQNVWQRSTNTHRAIFIAAVAVGLLVVGTVGWWSSRPQYFPLARNLGPSEAANVVSKLQAAGIDHQLDFSASTVYVPKQRLKDARLAARDILGDMPLEDSALSGSILDDPTMNQVRVNAEREKALERTVSQMKNVTSADVHIAVPEWSPWERNQAQPTATVAVGIRRGQSFTAEQAATIAALVAGSVEGLSTDRVTVADLAGRILHGEGKNRTSGLSYQFEYRKTIEADLVAKAETMLATMLGSNRAVVRISADMDFTELERIQKELDPDSEVKMNEMVESTTTSSLNRTAAGVVGVASNTAPGGGPTSSSSPISQNTEKAETEYQYSTTTDTRREPGGTIKRLTIAAMVDLPQPDPNANPPIAAVAKQDVEDIIKSAVGFDDQRDDRISVVVTTLSGTGPSVDHVIETLDRWDFYNGLLRNISLGIAAVVALVLGFMLIRKMQPISLPATSSPASGANRESVISELSRQAQKNPEVVSRIVASWLSTRQDGSSESASGEPSPTARRQTTAT